VTGRQDLPRWRSIIEQPIVPRWCWPQQTLAAQYITSSRIFPGERCRNTSSLLRFLPAGTYVPPRTSTSTRSPPSTTNWDKLRMKRHAFPVPKPRRVIVASVSCIYGLGSPGSLLRHAGHAGKRPPDCARSPTGRFVDIPVRPQRGSAPRHVPRPRDMIEIYPTYEVKPTA